MRTIVAGSRYIGKVSAAAMTRLDKFGITVVLSGHAIGVDRIGEEWAAERNIPVEVYPADWRQHGRAAGFRRNWQMAEKAQALFAIWDRKSAGTRHMISIAKRVGLKIEVIDQNGVKIPVDTI